MPEKQPKLTIQQAFEIYHHNNPDVFNYILREARRAKQRGKTKFGVKAIIEYLRWEQFMKTNTTDMFAKNGENSYKLDNRFTSRYARLLVEKYPEFEPMIEMRGLKSL